MSLGKSLGEEALRGRDAHLMRECFENDREYGSVMMMICDEISHDTTSAQLWFQMSGNADRFDGRLNPEVDPLDLQSITGGTLNLEAWPGTTAQFMAKQGGNYGVSITTVRGSFNLAKIGQMESLFNLARYARKMLFAKRFQIAAAEILKERERHLRAKLGLPEHAPITTTHRTNNPYFNHITLGFMNAYMKGSRDEKIFAIEDTDMTRVGHHQVQYASWAKGVQPIEE